MRRREPAQPTEGQRAGRAATGNSGRCEATRHPKSIALWHLDFHQAKIRLLDESGNWHHPIALAILDDRSRLCCHLQFYLAETAECLVHGLTQAIMKRGLPRALMTDNGAAMFAEETRQGLATAWRCPRNHLALLAIPERQAGGLLGRNWKAACWSCSAAIEDLKLAFINHAAQAWVEQDYHSNAAPRNRRHPLAADARRPRTWDAPHAGRATLCAWPLPARSSAPPAAVTPPSWSRASATNCPRDSATCARLALRSPGWDKSQMTPGRSQNRRTVGSPAAPGQSQKRLRPARSHRTPDKHRLHRQP